MIQRTLMFALCLLPVVSAHGPEPPRTQVRVDITLADGSEELSSVDDPDVRDVCQVLEPVVSRGLHARSGQRIEQMLRRAYGDLVESEKSLAHYKAVWSPKEERWIIVCCGPTTFLVDLEHPVQVRFTVETIIR